MPSNTSPSSFTPLNSPDRSRCSRVVLFRQKPRAKHHRTLFLAKSQGVRGVRWFGPFWPNPSTGRLDGLLGSFMSVWAHQNLRKYPLEGFWGCVLSSRKPQNPRKWRVGCCWGQSLYMRRLICPLFRVCVDIRGFESVKWNNHPGTFPLLFICLSFFLYVFVVISSSRETKHPRHDLADGVFVDVRRLSVHHSRASCR